MTDLCEVTEFTSEVNKFTDDEYTFGHLEKLRGLQSKSFKSEFVALLLRKDSAF